MGFDIMNVVIPAIPVIETFLSGMGRTNRFKRNWALDYLNSLQRMENDRLVIDGALTQWKMARQTLLERLRVIALEIGNHRKNSSYAKIISATTSLGGTLAVVVALATVTVTAGAATPFLVGGGVAGVLGGVTAGGASIAADVLSKKGAEEANRLVDEHNTAFSKLCQAQITYQDGIRTHIKIIETAGRAVLFVKRVRNATTVSLCMGRKSRKYIGTIRSIAQVGNVPGTLLAVFRVETDSGTAITVTIENVAQPVGNVQVTSPPSVNKLETNSGAGVMQTAVSAVARASIGLTDNFAEATMTIAAGSLIRSLGMVAESIAIGFDVYTIISTALDMNAGNLDEAAAKIDQLVQTLGNVTPPTLNDVIIESVIPVAGNLGIPFEGDYVVTRTAHVFYYKEEWVVTS
ncbi:uncharacterized protein [Antedon mediterranea]|uniref:uncharacterized protein n=1 Tax=Antedon mediterranea TaxID=105859 RepID=UPI003AF88F00